MSVKSRNFAIVIQNHTIKSKKDTKDNEENVFPHAAPYGSRDDNRHFHFLRR